MRLNTRARREYSKGLPDRSCFGPMLVPVAVGVAVRVATNQAQHEAGMNLIADLLRAEMGSKLQGPKTEENEHGEHLIA